MGQVNPVLPFSSPSEGVHPGPFYRFLGWAPEACAGFERFGLLASRFDGHRAFSLVGLSVVPVPALNVQ